MLEIREIVDQAIDTSLERILREYAAAAFTRLNQIMHRNQDGISIADSDKLTELQAAAIASLEMTEECRGDVVARKFTFRLHHKLAALDSLARNRRLFADALANLHFDPREILECANARIEAAQRRRLLGPDLRSKPPRLEAALDARGKKLLISIEANP
jgi:hypothetical protein